MFCGKNCKNTRNVLVITALPEIEVVTYKMIRVLQLTINCSLCCVPMLLAVPVKYCSSHFTGTQFDYVDF